MSRPGDLVRLVPRPIDPGDDYVDWATGTVALWCDDRDGHVDVPLGSVALVIATESLGGDMGPDLAQVLLCIGGDPVTVETFDDRLVGIPQ